MARFGWVVVGLLVCVVHAWPEEPGGSLDSNQKAAVSQFFGALDGNSDGEIDETEARKYIGESIGGAEFNTTQKLDAAVDQMTNNVDGTDPLTTISVAELQKHLADLLRGSSVGEWVRHGLNLPQHEDTFKRNAITAVDFPMLMEDEEILEKDLQVTSRLHRAQIKRGLQLLILGLGKVPHPPQEFRCIEVDCEEISLRWSYKPGSSTPPVHKFVLESRSSRDVSSWKQVLEQDASDADEYVVSVPWLPSKDAPHSFRITAWSAYGRSEKVNAGPCEHLVEGKSCNMEAHSGQPKLEDVTRNAGAAGTTQKSSSEGDKRSLATGAVVLLLTIAVRFLHSRHISVARCLTFLGLSRLAAALRLEKLESWLGTCPGSPKQENKEDKDNQGDVVEAPLNRALGSYESNLNSSRTLLMSIDSSTSSARDVVGRLDESSTTLGSDPKVDDGFPNQGVWGVDRMGSVAETFPSASWESMDESGEFGEDGFQGDDLPQVDHPELISGQCSHATCTNHWRGLRRWRKRTMRHYCGICQLAYCVDHTQIIAHGPLTSCSQQSQCVCVNCYEKLSPDRKRQLDRTNKLGPPSSRSSKFSNSEAGSFRDGSSNLGRWSFGRLTGRSRRTGSMSNLSIGSDSSGRLESTRALMNWSRAGKKVRAVCTLKLAGKELERRRSAGQE